MRILKILLEGKIKHQGDMFSDLDYLKFDFDVLKINNLDLLGIYPHISGRHFFFSFFFFNVL